MDKKVIDLINAKKEATIVIEKLGDISEIEKDELMGIQIRDILSKQYKYTNDEIQEILKRHNTSLI